MTHRVEIPLLNTNEPEANLACLHVENGEKVASGDLICTLETTKSTMELAAEVDGFIVGVSKQVGDQIRAGELLCYIAEDPAWQPPVDELTTQAGTKAKDDVPAGLRITEPAKALAARYSLSLDDLPRGPIVTEKIILSMVKPGGGEAVPIPEADIDETSIIIYGGGGHGKAVQELIESTGHYNVLGYLDDGIPAGEIILGLPVLGGKERLAELKEKGARYMVNAVGGIGNVRIRIQVFEHILAAGFECPTIIHPTAFVEPSAQIAGGVQVFPHAYIGSESVVGFGSIVNTGAIISHDCDLGMYVNLSPGGILAGGVVVGDTTLIGMGATVNLLVRLGKGARIGNGATVKTDVPAKGIVRAGHIWPES